MASRVRIAGDDNGKALKGVEAIAEMLDVPRTWVYDQVALNAIPHRKMGKYLRFDPERVLAAYPEKGGPAHLYREDLGQHERARHADQEAPTRKQR